MRKVTTLQQTTVRTVPQTRKVALMARRAKMTKPFALPTRQQRTERTTATEQSDLYTMRDVARPMRRAMFEVRMTTEQRHYMALAEKEKEMSTMRRELYRDQETRELKTVVQTTTVKRRTMVSFRQHYQEKTEIMETFGKVSDGGKILHKRSILNGCIHRGL